MLIRFRASEKRNGQDIEFPLVIRQQILNYMDHLVQRGKLVKIITPVNETNEIGKEKIVAKNVSFKAAEGVIFDKQFIVTDKGDSVLIDDALTPTDLELCTPTWFLTTSSRVSLEKFGLGSQALDTLGLIYNEVLSDALLSITYDQLDPNSLLRITLPTIPTGENILLPKGFTRYNVSESVNVYRLNNTLDNSAIRDLANFNHLQKDIYAAATQVLLNNTVDTQERFNLQEIHRIAMDGSEQRRKDLSTQINSNLKKLTDDIEGYDKQIAELDRERNAVPRSFHRREQRKTLKDHDTHSKELAARKSKKEGAWHAFSATGQVCATVILLPFGLVALPFTGPFYGYKNFRYNNKKYSFNQSEILRTYPEKKKKIEDQIAIVDEEAKRYLEIQKKLVDGVQIIEIEESFSTSSSGFYSRRNPVNMSSSSSSSSSQVVQGQPVSMEEPEMQEVAPEFEIPSKLDLC